MLRAIALSAVLMLAAAPAVTARTPKADPYVPAGNPVNCLQINTIRSTDVRDDRTIDFITNGNKVFRNILPNSCPGLWSERSFLYRTSINQLCSVDIITVLYNGGGGPQRGASCGLGQFQPMAKKPK
jgi:hypothetical protein